MDEPVSLESIEIDLLADRSSIQGAVDNWNQLSKGERQRFLKRFAHGELVRPEFEAALAEDPKAEEVWQTFCVTEQRELLGTVDQYRFWPRRWEIRRAIRRGVKPGPCYPNTDAER